MYLVSIAKGKDPSVGVKLYQTPFLLLFHFYLLSGCDLFNMFCRSSISLMATLDNLCSNLLNIRNKIMNIKRKKIFCGPSKMLKYISCPINICLKYFMSPTKTHTVPHGPVSYILNVRSFTLKIGVYLI